MRQYCIVVEADRCIGCKGGCQVACKTENEVALGTSRSTLYTMGPTGSYPDLNMYFLPVMCQQCENPSCVEVCPTGACYKNDEDGVIYIDRDICIGCQSCKRACPFHANNFNKELRVMDKCNVCAQRREAGEIPAVGAYLCGVCRADRLDFLPRGHDRAGIFLYPVYVCAAQRSRFDGTLHEPETLDVSGGGAAGMWSGAVVLDEMERARAGAGWIGDGHKLDRLHGDPVVFHFAARQQYI